MQVTDEAIREGLDDIDHGRTRPAEELFDEIRRKYAIPRSDDRIDRDHSSPALPGERSR